MSEFTAKTPTGGKNNENNQAENTPATGDNSTQPKNNDESKNDGSNKPAANEDPALARLQKLWLEHIPVIIVNKPDGTEYSIKYKSQKRFQTRRIRLSNLPPRIPNAIRILITTVKPKKVQKKKTCLPYKKFKKM